MKLFLIWTWPLWMYGAVVIVRLYFRYSQSMYGVMSGISWVGLLRDKGALGEFYTFLELERFPGYHHLLTNVYLPRPKGGRTEVDLILICEAGVFVIESKNYGGWIYGNEKNRYWTQVFPNQHKERFYNPILQNAGHIVALRDVTGLESEYFHSIVVFGERCKLKGIHVESDESRVIKRKQMKRILREECKFSENYLSTKEVDELYYRKLLQFSHADQEQKEEHIRKLRG